jgi:hypothetical protein
MCTSKVVTFLNDDRVTDDPFREPVSDRPPGRSNLPATLPHGEYQPVSRIAGIAIVSLGTQLRRSHAKVSQTVEAYGGFRVTHGYANHGSRKHRGFQMSSQCRGPVPGA